jgi:hypothetical protein
MENMLIPNFPTIAEVSPPPTKKFIRVKKIIQEEPIKEKKYNQMKYNKNFAEKNKEKINERKICPICCGSYTYYNKSTHFKSIKHIMLTAAKGGISQ